MILQRQSGPERGRSFWEVEPASDLLAAPDEPGRRREERAERLGQQPATLLLTGLTGAGKTTLAYALERRLFDAGRQVMVLDGENLRLGISRDLGFSSVERSENLRRAAEVARLANQSGLICICSLLAPSEAVRERVRETIGAERFLEVYLSAPLEVCRARETGGMYARADAGEIARFPGVSAPYDVPAAPDLVLPTARARRRRLRRSGGAAARGSRDPLTPRRDQRIRRPSRVARQRPARRIDAARASVAEAAGGQRPQRRLREGGEHHCDRDRHELYGHVRLLPWHASLLPPRCHTLTSNERAAERHKADPSDERRWNASRAPSAARHRPAGRCPARSGIARSDAKPSAVNQAPLRRRDKNSRTAGSLSRPIARS